MEITEINRAFLETLSFSDLVKVADEYGIDVPDDLNRAFLIGEIIEVVSDMENSMSQQEMIISDEEFIAEEKEMSVRSYNITEVQIMLRNPAWAFVYWNISDSDRISLDKAFISQMMLRISSFSEKDQIKPDDFFDIQISKEDDGQYVLLPAGKKYFRIDLLFNIDGIIDILSSSKVMEMPVGADVLADIRPGRKEACSEIMKLSGYSDMLLEHYKNHRESFS
ncbi:MAG: DUF4912 domain-containing protein [Treponema sp.]|nr:DUF4912 domain-containing protein [Treponema sp.]